MSEAHVSGGTMGMTGDPEVRPEWAVLLAGQPISRAGALYAGMKRAHALLEATPDEPTERAHFLRRQIAAGEYVPPVPRLAEQLLRGSGILPLPHDSPPGEDESPTLPPSA